MQKTRTRKIHGFVAAALFFACLAALVGLSWQGNARAEVKEQAAALYDAPEDSWRFGLCVVPGRGPISDYEVSVLRAGWYSDYTFRRKPNAPYGMEYFQTVRVGGSPFPSDPAWWGWLEDAVLANPGSVWMIGNEPDCIWQDDLYPNQYAQRFHEVRAFILARDPTARIAIGAIVQPTPLRLEWLDMVLQEYDDLYHVSMTEHVDIWNIHNQINREHPEEFGAYIPKGFPPGTVGRLYTIQDSDNLDIFIQHVRAFRQWMKDRGVQDKPLIISEYGVLQPVEYGFTADRVKDYMIATHTYMLHATDASIGNPADGNRLVQRWAWYSMNDKPFDFDTYTGFNGALFDWEEHYPGELTSHGWKWARFMNDQPFPTPTPSSTPRPTVFRREVEEGTFHEPVAPEYNANASGCCFVRFAGAHLTAGVEVSLYAKDGGNYTVWARVDVPSGGSNAVRVKVDDNPEFRWKVPWNVSGWMWDQISEDGVADPKIVYLSAGWHKFRFYPQWGEMCIDTLELTKVGVSPLRKVQACDPPDVDIPLAAGANLVSFPVVVDDTAISSVLASVWSKVSKVYAYDASDTLNPWKVYDKSLPPGASTLTHLDNTQGFWVYLSSAGTLTVEGQFPGWTIFQLQPGANLISWPAMDERSVAYVISPIGDKVTKIYRYDSSDPGNPWRVYDASLPPGANTLTHFEPGAGYWIYVDEYCELSVVD